MDRRFIEYLFSSPPVCETDRLILRPLEVSDYLDMYDYSRYAEVTRYLTWEPHPSPSFTKRYLYGVKNAYKNGTFYDWALELKANGKMIGTCGFTSFDYKSASFEIGYVINPRYRMYGLATEAASFVISFGFDRLSALSASARCMPQNRASMRVMEKCGLVFKCEEPHSVLKGASFVNVLRFEMTKEQYLAVASH